MKNKIAKVLLTAAVLGAAVFALSPNANDRVLNAGTTYTNITVTQGGTAGDAASSDMFVAAVGYHYWTGVEYGNAGGMTAERISVNTTIEM